MAGLAVTRDDIMALANQTAGQHWMDEAHIQRFAALVAAAEREAIWGMLFEYAGRDDLSDSDQSLLKHLADLIRARGQE